MARNLSTPIQYFKGIGPKRAKLFERLGIRDIEDVLYLFPRRYEDRSSFVSIAELKPGEFQTIQAEVVVASGRSSFRQRRLALFEAVVSDASSRVHCVWFNQPYLDKIFKVGTKAILHGRVEQYRDRLQMTAPEFEILDEDEDTRALSVGRIVPVYTVTEGMTQRLMRSMVKTALDEFTSQINDVLPFDIRTRYNLLNLAQSLINIHFPKDLTIKEEAYRRLAFEEFFLYQLPILLRKRKARQLEGISHTIDAQFLQEFEKMLSFQLTGAQQWVLKEIQRDLSSPRPMQRLLQGEVGSGKTIVACYAALIAIRAGSQVAVMAPTELLANQHYQSLLTITAAIRKKFNFNICIVRGSLDAKTKKKLSGDIGKGAIQLVVGTHSLIQDEVKFKNLGLVVIDEQHKFGVEQRTLLPKKGNNPDVLIMTATPIPRTLSLTIYGDLDISTLNELPAGRIPIKTRSFHSEQREEAYDFVGQKIKEGRQAYVIFPVIEESAALDMRGAKSMHRELSERFNKYSVGLIHGQMKQSEQDAVMSDFKKGDIDILVATSVLEVGIDVANATVLVIEHAERFGLSQLHQLRGRIGRGSHESHCLIIASPQTPEAVARIHAIETISDGFRIAEEDLRIRGPGEFFGRRQHGLTELRIADPISQMHLLKQARDEAVKLIGKDPDLSSHQNEGLRKVLMRRFPDYEQFLVLT